MTTDRLTADARLGLPFLNLVMDNCPHMIFVKDRASRFIYANKALLALFAPDKRAGIVGSTGNEDFPDPEARVFVDEDRKAFERGESDIIEEVTDHLGIRRTFMTKKIRFAGWDGEPLLLGIATDITKLAAREDELVKTNGLLENFAALAAHDLRAPLCTFISYLALVQGDDHSRLSGKAAGYLDVMERSATNLLGQITGLLETYKARGKQLACAAPDLALVFREVVVNLDALIRSTNATVLCNPLPTIAVDPHLFQHLIANLFENSLKYSAPRDPIIILKYAEGDGEHLFSVEDNGTGISPAHEARAFQLYEQVGGQKSAGVGLGLALCKSIVELHGGKIWVDHNHRNGCRICFTFLKHQGGAMPAAVEPERASTKTLLLA